MGKIYKHGKNSDYYRIAGLNNLSVLIKHLDTFPLLTRSFGLPSAAQRSEARPRSKTSRPAPRSGAVQHAA